LKKFVAFLWQTAPIVPVLPTPPAFNSFAVNKMPLERLHTVEVAGSNPAAPTIESMVYRHRGGKSLLQVAPAIL
jgi:hypothetical protein